MPEIYAKVSVNLLSLVTSAVPGVGPKQNFRGRLQENQTEVEHVTRCCHDRPADEVHPGMHLHVLDQSSAAMKAQDIVAYPSEASSSRIVLIASIPMPMTL